MTKPTYRAIKPLIHSSVSRCGLLVSVCLWLAILTSPALVAQPLINRGDSLKLSYQAPEEYTVAAVRAVGIQYLDPDALVSVSGIKPGDRMAIPGDAVTAAIRKLWDQGVLSDISLRIEKIEGDKVWLVFDMKERPRLSRFSFKGIRRGEANDLREKVNLARGRVVTDAVIKNSQNVVRKFFVGKGFFNVNVKVTPRPDSALRNTVTLYIEVAKGQKVKIRQITIDGNSSESDAAIKKRFKDTKERKPWRFWKSSKYIATKYDKDKDRLIEWYNKNGYRDASILKDSLVRVDDRYIDLKISLEEGPKYYFRNITWTGNYLYPSKTLSDILGIKKGEVYNQENLEHRTNYNPNGADVSSLYMDDGYLFFRVTPVETQVDGDSIDVEMRVYEGQQATINRVNVTGNTKTSDHVVMREIRTLPGQKFSRSDLIRTNRELAQLGYFDPEQIGINPVPNPADGTVDIHYSVVEKPSDQIQLSGGWGGYYGFVGTLGLVFNNFSVRKVPHLGEWAPLPSGDGQRVSVNFQANGKQFQTYSASFTEPWLGGKRPNSLTVGLSYSVQSSYANASYTQIVAGLRVGGMTVSLARRLRWPDDYFSLSHTASLQRFSLFNYPLLTSTPINGVLSQFSFINTLSRNSINNPVFPTSGSSFSLSVNLTPPYSLMGVNPKYGFNSERSSSLKLVEFHKWMFDGSYFIGIAKNLVISTRAHYGFLGYYTKEAGIGPFERFKVGGSGLTGFNYLIGYDIIGLRGYDDNSITPTGLSGSVGNGGYGGNSSSAGIIYNKYVFELRYALSTNPAATIYTLAFAEAGNNWAKFKDFNPFNVYRSAGLGVRIMMPAFGLLGVDYGFGFDKPDLPLKNKGQFTFSIGQQIR